MSAKLLRKGFSEVKKTGCLDEKLAELSGFILTKGRRGVAVAFSGGVDSSTLAALCYSILGKKAVAVTAKSPTYTPEELQEAEAVAKHIGIAHYIVETDEMLDENFSRNPENRCYYCKKALLKRLKETASKLGCETVFEGTNYSDLATHRPGYLAVKETQQVYSPWAETRFTKEEIRYVARKLGLPNADKPANACLASRIPYYEKITPERLERISKAERQIRALTGITQVRVRDHNGIARIEVEKTQRERFFNIEVLDQVARELKALGFTFVTLDVEGYKQGSMLLTLNEKAENE